MTAVLLSVKPTFAMRLLSGHKTAEVRRRFPPLPRGTIVYLYASSPTRALIGVLRIVSVNTASPDVLWSRFGACLDIAEEYFRQYLEEKETATVIEMQVDERWTHPVSLEAMRAGAGVNPPQSYRYLNPEQEQTLRELSRRTRN